MPPPSPQCALHASPPRGVSPGFLPAMSAGMVAGTVVAIRTMVTVVVSRALVATGAVVALNPGIRVSRTVCPGVQLAAMMAAMMTVVPPMGTRMSMPLAMSMAMPMATSMVMPVVEMAGSRQLVPDPVGGPHRQSMENYLAGMVVTLVTRTSMVSFTSERRLDAEREHCQRALRCRSGPVHRFIPLALRERRSRTDIGDTGCVPAWRWPVTR